MAGIVHDDLPGGKIDELELPIDGRQQYHQTNQLEEEKPAGKEVR